MTKKNIFYSRKQVKYQKRFKGEKVANALKKNRVYDALEKKHKNLIKKSKELEQTKNITHSKALLQDAMEKYVNDILRLQQNIRNLNNEFIFIESSYETQIQILNEIQ